jgi:hypothetical protein
MKLPSVSPVKISSASVKLQPPPKSSVGGGSAYRTPLIKGSSLVSMKTAHLPPKASSPDSPSGPYFTKAPSVAQVSRPRSPRAARFANLKPAGLK